MFFVQCNRILKIAKSCSLVPTQVLDPSEFICGLEIFIFKSSFATLDCSTTFVGSGFSQSRLIKSNMVQLEANQIDQTELKSWRDETGRDEWGSRLASAHTQKGSKKTVIRVATDIAVERHVGFLLYVIMHLQKK